MDRVNRLGFKNNPRRCTCCTEGYEVKATMANMTRKQYADLYGPTTGDKIRLGDTNLFVEIEKDIRVCGEEAAYGGGHAPDIIRIVGQSSVLPSSTNPALPFGVSSQTELFDMTIICHNLNPKITTDVAFAESRVRMETIAAENVLPLTMVSWIVMACSIRSCQFMEHVQPPNS